MKARLLSISTDRGFSIEWPNMQVPEAEVLVLNFQTKSYSLPKFVEQMNNLKVIVIAKDDYQSADISNFELLGSSSNLKSVRLEGISIACITRKPMQLSSLKKISLYKCVIGLTFSNEVVKMSDAFPVLEEMNIQECKYLGNLLPEICDLIQLKKLSITDHSDIEALPEEFGNLVNIEVLRLRSCYDLLKLPISIGNLKKLKLLDIFNCISITELPPSIGELSSLRKLNMKWCYKIKKLPLSVLLLDQLEEVICDEATKPYLWDLFSNALRNTRMVAT
ncbi:PREDICTED: probable disease resistance protein At5g66900-like [Fragaria vesca subsp. vesca]